MTPALLETHALSVRYGDTTALAGLSLRLEAGRIVGLVGESGSGKSTAALAILGLMPPAARAAGEIRLRGGRIDDLPPRARRGHLGRDIAFVPQEPLTALNPTMRIGRALDLPLRAALGGDAATRRGLAARSLAAMGIEDTDRILGAYPFQLSGGQLQRVLLAQALVLNAAVIVADEPTTALDVTAQAEVLHLIARAAREEGRAVLLITHNMAVVWRLCDEVVILRHGAVVESGPAREVLRRPARSYTRDLIAALPSLSPPRMPLPVAAGDPA